MNHQNGRKKLNMSSSHRKSLLRNQVIHLITYGCLQTTKARIKEVQKVAEKMVTIARRGSDFNTIRTLKRKLPYSEKAVYKLIKEIAVKYLDRSGGYTRVIAIGKRESDTADISRLEWI